MTGPAETSNDLRIAVIGGGAAGLTAGYLLQRRHRVTLFERENRLGGHANTVEIQRGRDRGLAVDTGFIVYNEENYPLFTKLLGELGVASKASDMSFGYTCERRGLEYSGTSLGGLFAQRTNLMRPGYWSFLRQIVRFSRIARRRLTDGTLGRETLADFLASTGCGPALSDDYAVPLAAAIWSGSRRDVMGFPAESLLRFFDNHGLLRLCRRPLWRTIAGGSREYVARLRARLRGEVVTGGEVRGVRRDETGASICLSDGSRRSFDRVVIATHADQALRLLEDADDAETDALGAWRYNRSTTILHEDPRLMPASRRAWASWNYHRSEASADEHPVVVTYHMNRLQRLESGSDYFVSLNAPSHRSPRDQHGRFEYAHPRYDWPALESQPKIAALNGTRNTYYCGSYLGHGFHEDAVRAGNDVATRFGLTL